jgi:hypothetical protein
MNIYNLVIMLADFFNLCFLKNEKFIFLEYIFSKLLKISSIVAAEASWVKCIPKEKLHILKFFLIRDLCDHQASSF